MMNKTRTTRLPKRSPIGLDLGDHSIKAVQLRGDGSRWSLSAATSFVRRNPEKPIDSAEVERLCGVLDRAGFVGRDVVVAAPSTDLMTGILDLPPRSPGVPFDQIARMEFARVHKCEPQSFELSYWDLPTPARAAKGTQVMSVAYAHSAADRYLDVVESAGLNVVAVDSAASAMTRSCSAFTEIGTTAILDLGHSGASLALTQSGMLTYERRLPDIGLKPLNAALRQQLDLGDEEISYLISVGGFGQPDDRRGAEQFAAARRLLASHFAPLLQDLRLTFTYAEQQYPQAPVKLLLLVGGGAAIAALDQHMQSALDVDVRTVKPSDVLECPPELMDRATSAVMTAVGLAQFDEE
jgi:Tfp pilus assembly PilM family ATPase